MPPLSIDKESDRRLIPERRRYSYSMYLPERRGNVFGSTFIKSVKKPPQTNERVKPSSHMKDQHSKKSAVLPDVKPRLPSRIYRKKMRRHAHSSISLWKQQLLVSLEKEMNKKGHALLTKKELIQLIQKL
jgi:hypothetical protein